MNSGYFVAEQIKQELLEQLRNGRYAGNSKLPPEMEVAQELGVSRTMIRDVLSALEREGFISRKHGVGTIINQHILKVKTRMDQEKEFLKMVADEGYRPRMDVPVIEICEAGKAVAELLCITPDDRVIRSVRIVWADERPAICCVDYIALASVVSEEYDLQVLKNPIFEFIDQYCKEGIYLDLAEVRAVAAEEFVAGALRIDSGCPVLYMKEIGYTFAGTPFFCSDEYFADGILHHMVVRKKL